MEISKCFTRLWSNLREETKSSGNCVYACQKRDNIFDVFKHVKLVKLGVDQLKLFIVFTEIGTRVFKYVFKVIKLKLKARSLETLDWDCGFPSNYKVNRNSL